MHKIILFSFYSNQDIPAQFHTFFFQKKIAYLSSSANLVELPNKNIFYKISQTKCVNNTKRLSSFDETNLRETNFNINKFLSLKYRFY